MNEQQYPRRGVKAKNIKSMLRKKVDSWLATIEDEELRKLAAENTIVTGGCIASLLLGEPVNDFDLYFRTKEVASKLAHYYVARFKPKDANGIACKISVVDHEADGRVKIVIKSAGIASENGTDKPYEYFEGQPPEAAAGYVAEVMTDPGAIEDVYEETEQAALKADEGKKFRPVFMSTNAITLSHKLQLILRFYGEPDQIHENYDYVHCTNYWQSWGDHSKSLVLRPEALESLLARELRYVGSKYPLCSIIRMRKFLARGWVINAGQVVKMCFQVSELDLKNLDVLRDQLTGVDVAYFCQLCDLLSAKDPTKVDGAYLVEIINRLF